MLKGVSYYMLGRPLGHVASCIYFFLSIFVLMAISWPPREEEWSIIPQVLRLLRPKHLSHEFIFLIHPYGYELAYQGGRTVHSPLSAKAVKVQALKS